VNIKRFLEIPFIVWAAIFFTLLLATKIIVFVCKLIIKNGIFSTFLVILKGIGAFMAVIVGITAWMMAPVLVYQWAQDFPEKSPQRYISFAVNVAWLMATIYFFPHLHGPVEDCVGFGGRSNC